MTLATFQKQLETYFNKEDLRELCFSLEIEYENFPTETRKGMARELVRYCADHGCLEELVLEVRTQRPHPKWDIPTLPDGRIIIDRPTKENKFLERVNSMDIEKYLEQEVPKEMWIKVEKEFNNRPESREIIDILGNDKTAMILGETGSGKTIAMYRLVRALIEEAQVSAKQPLPVLLDVSSWTFDVEQGKKQDFVNWFKIAFRKKYSGILNLAEKKLANNDLILLLDGLDQIESRRRRTFMEALLDHYKDIGLENVVIACRTDVYADLDPKPNMPKIIELSPLNANLSPAAYQQKLSVYITQLEKTEPSLKELRIAIENNENLSQAVNTPLTLRDMIDVYKTNPNKALEVSKSENVHVVRRFLSEAYVEGRLEEIEQEAKLKSESLTYDSTQSRDWLTWLAQESLPLFYIEDMQPGWLPANMRNWYRLLLTLLLSLIFGLPTGLAVGFVVSTKPDLSAPVAGIYAGVIFGLVLGLGVSFSYAFLPDGWPSVLGIGLTGFIASIILFNLTKFTFTGGVRLGLVTIVVTAIINLFTNILKDKQRIQVEEFNPDWKKAIPRTGLCLMIGLFIGGILEGLFSGDGWFTFVMFFTIPIAALVLAHGFRQPVLSEELATPNQGIHRAFRNALWSSLTVTVFCWVTMYILAWRSTQIIGLPPRCAEPFYLWYTGEYVTKNMIHLAPLGGCVSDFGAGIAFASLIGLGVFLVNGGLTTIKHYTLRFMLQRMGNIPTGKYDLFLDYADDKLKLLRKMGAGYEYRRNLKRYFNSDHTQTE